MLFRSGNNEGGWKTSPKSKVRSPASARPRDLAADFLPVARRLSTFGSRWSSLPPINEARECRGNNEGGWKTSPKFKVRSPASARPRHLAADFLPVACRVSTFGSRWSSLPPINEARECRGHNDPSPDVFFAGGRRRRICEGIRCVSARRNTILWLRRLSVPHIWC